MLHQKLFFKDLLDHSSNKLELSETLETRMMPRLSKMINDDDQAGHILINALLKPVSYTHLTLPTIYSV